jgi:hypothetical protein
MLRRSDVMMLVTMLERATCNVHSICTLLSP